MTHHNRRKHSRFPLISAIHEDVKMYISPPLIEDPVSVTIHELSAGGMSLETKVPLPTRFLFTIIFTPPGIKKIHAEGKAVHVIKTSDGYQVGLEFTKIDPEIYETINHIARDAHACDERIQHNNTSICVSPCLYSPLCSRKEKSA